MRRIGTRKSAPAQPLGRLLLAFLSDEIRLVDIALLPEYRNAGLGAALVEWVQAQARAAGKAVRLHVRPDNRACRLYERLGFTLAEASQTDLLLEWRASATSQEISDNLPERNQATHVG